MGDIEYVAMKLVEAVKGVYVATGAFTVSSFDSFVEAHMQPEKFEKITEGREVKLVGRGLDQDYPYQREVMIGGVKFFCLLTEAEKGKVVEDDS